MANDLTVVDADEVGELELNTSAEKYQNIESDLNEIQENLMKNAEKLSLQIPQIMEFATAAQHPKMYEALAKIIVAYSAINRDAAAVAKQKTDLLNSQRRGPEEKSPNVVNNDNRQVNFHGTATDLLDKVLKGKE